MQTLGGNGGIKRLCYKKLATERYTTKTVNYYIKLPYTFEVIASDEGGFVVRFPELPGCITCGETAEAACANAIDAKRAWIEAALEEDIPIYEPPEWEDCCMTLPERNSVYFMGVENRSHKAGKHKEHDC